MKCFACSIDIANLPESDPLREASEICHYQSAIVLDVHPMSEDCRAGVVCWNCFLKLERADMIDMWIDREIWQWLNPTIPFEHLPILDHEDKECWEPRLYKWKSLRYQMLQWPFPSGYEPTDDEVRACRNEQGALWDVMTDEERSAAGVPRIFCAICKKDYGRGYGKKQASDCAASIHYGHDKKLYLTCHYGSDGDGNAYEVRPLVLIEESQLFMPYEPADPVCDACVRGYAAVGMLRLLGDFLHEDSVSRKVFGKTFQEMLNAPVSKK